MSKDGDNQPVLFSELFSSIKEIQKMYRRIQLITHLVPRNAEYHPIIGHQRDFISGLCFASYHLEIIDAWFMMPIPKKRVGKNVRFFFTEKGWERYGRPTVAACIKHRQEYRVIAVEEHDRRYEVYYKDDIQVCLRPRRKEKRA